MTGVALLGAGRWGRVLADALDGPCRLVAVWNRSDDAALAAVRTAHPGARTTHDLASVLADPAVEAVVVATPNATHAGLAHAALAAGKHVLVEKPLATSARDARALADAAGDAGLVLFTGHVFLHDPAMREVVDLARRDAVATATFAWSKTGTFAEDLLWNLAVHDVALALEVFGAAPAEARLVAEAGVRTPRDVATAELAFPDGGRAVLHWDRTAPSRRKTATFATRSGDVLAWEPGSLLRLGPDGAFRPVFATKDEPLRCEIDAFLACVRGEADAGTARAVEVVGVVERLAGGRP